MMGAGKYRDFVLIEKQVTTPDGRGGDVITWATHCQEPAWIERAFSFRANQERIEAGGLRSRPIVQIHVRAHTLTEAITPDMRVRDLDRGIWFAINVVQDIAGDRREITITAAQNMPS